MSSLLEYIHAIRFSPSLMDMTFVVMLVLAGLIRGLVPIGLLGVYGALISTALIGFGSPPTLLAIGGVTLLYVYPLAILISRLRASDHSHSARWVMRFGNAGLVGMMVGFKVHLFFRLPLIGDAGIANHLLNLLGFSYFLFRAINYLYMQVLSKAGPGSPFDLIFYMLFPTTLTSGPIQKYLDFKVQLTTPVPLDRNTLGTAIYRITQGYFYKYCLGYFMLGVVHYSLRGDVMYAWESLATTISLYLYFFFDFAGYCHVAIGLGLLLGIRVPENFRKPFVATSITEFWRNWHITLVDWFRDHVFIAFGGMRASRFKASSLAFVIMFFVGLWHGLTWGCLIWGCWHGLLLFVEGMTGSRPMPPSERHGPVFWYRVAFTNMRVAAGELLFLATPGIGTWDDFWRVCQGFLTWW